MTESKESEVKFGIYRRERDATGNVHLKNVGTDTFTNNKRIVLVFPGQRTTSAVPDKWQRHASGYLKGVEEMLERGRVAPEHVNICSVVYSHHLEKGLSEYMFGNRNALRLDGPADELAVVHRALLPIMGIRPQKKPPNVEAACRNLSRLTIMSHSMGVAFSQNVCALFVDELARLGYTPEEVTKIQHAIVNVAIAGPLPLKDDRPNFTTFAFSGLFDRTHMDVAHFYGEAHHGVGTPEAAAARDKAYKAIGLDPDLLTRLLPELEPEDKLSGSGRYKPKQSYLTKRVGTHGYAFFADLPNFLEDPGRMLQIQEDRPIAAPSRAEHVFPMFRQPVRDEDGKALNGAVLTKLANVMAGAAERPLMVDNSREYRRIATASGNRVNNVCP